MELPYAEDIGHYWQTGTSSPDTWIEKAKRLIEEVGGTITADAYGAMENRAAFMIAFNIGEDRFKVVFPVLESRTRGRDAARAGVAAKRQAATMLYHDIKAKCMVASVMGTKAAFFSYLMLPDGRTASEVATPELAQNFPLLLRQ